MTPAMPGQATVQPNGHPAYIGLDVYKDTIALSVARAGREAPESWGEIREEKQIASRMWG